MNGYYENGQEISWINQQIISLKKESINKIEKLDILLNLLRYDYHKERHEDYRNQIRNLVKK